MPIVRLLAICLVLALPSAAGAEEDEDGDFIAQPKRSVGLTLLAHGSRLGGRAETGIGPALDLAIGRGRWQYFIEGAIASSAVGEGEMRTTGRLAHAGLGARWLARQFRDQNRTGGFEMFLSGLLGLERFYLDDGTRLTRPELAVGFGLHGRLYKRPRIGVRFDFRIVFTPSDDENVLVACRGRCMGEAGTNTGFMIGMGLTW